MIKYKQLIDKCNIDKDKLSWFYQLKFPKLRKIINNREQPIIEVGADGMRVGKTTAVKTLVNILKENNKKVKGSFEEYLENPYLKKSYSDPKNSILDSQKWFIKHKHQQLKNAPKNRIFIQDVNPEMDFCYAVSNALMGRMSLSQFDKYFSFYESLDWDLIPQPNLLVYLKVSDNVLLKRVKKSLREFETVDEKYFLIMKLVNRTWFDSVNNKMNVLEINTDNLNFAEDKNAKTILTKNVLKSLNYA